MQPQRAVEIGVFIRIAPANGVGQILPAHRFQRQRDHGGGVFLQLHQGDALGRALIGGQRAIAHFMQQTLRRRLAGNHLRAVSCGRIAQLGVHQRDLRHAHLLPIGLDIDLLEQHVILFRLHRQAADGHAARGDAIGVFLLDLFEKLLLALHTGAVRTAVGAVLRQIRLVSNQVERVRIRRRSLMQQHNLPVFSLHARSSPLFFSISSKSRLCCPQDPLPAPPEAHGCAHPRPRPWRRPARRRAHSSPHSARQRLLLPFPSNRRAAGC